LGGRKTLGISLKNLVGLLILFFIISMLSIPVDAALDNSGTETLITTNSSSIPSFPTIYGDFIAWTDFRGYPFNSDIYVYNVVTGEEYPARNPAESTDNDLPALSGEYAVYQAFDSVFETYTYDIHRFQLSTHMITNVTPDTPYSNQITPGISDYWIAWRDDTDTCDVVLYDMDAEVNPGINPKVIASDTDSCYLYPPSPLSISGSKVVWDGWGNSSYDIFLYDDETGTIYNITNDPYDQQYPKISGNYVVWQDKRNGNWDIFFANISNLSDILVTPLTTDLSDQMNPAIDGNLVVWEDKQSGSQIYLSDISDPGSWPGVEITDGINDHYNPKISGNRIVYEKVIEDNVGIYLFTHGLVVECPVANFSASSPAFFETAPYDMEFMSTISNPPSDLKYFWDFGDGSVSIDTNPSHLYATMGIFNVSLTVSNASCRNAITKTNFVTIGTTPEVNFTGTPTCGLSPLSVSFTDHSSGQPSAWAWDFDDNGIPDGFERNPSHIYAQGGIFSVNLTATNSIGSGYQLKSDYISVMNQSGIFDTNIDGLTIYQGGEGFLLNKSILNNYSIYENETILSILPPNGNGIKEITLFSDGTGFTNTTDEVMGNISKVLLTSKQIPLEGFSETIGSGAYINFTLELPKYPSNGEVIVYSYEGALPCDYQNYRRIVEETGFTQIVRSAYQIQFVTSNLDSISNMTLSLAVNSSWVIDFNKVWVVRIGDDMVGQVLPTNHIYEDTDKNLSIFSAYSPRGPSKFLLTTLSTTGNPLQIIVLIVQQLFNVGSDSSSEGVPTFIPATPTPTLTSVPTPQAPSEGIGHLLTDSEGVLSESLEVQAEDMMGTLSIFAGTKALSADGTPLSNISIHRLDAEDLSSLPVEESFQGIAYELLPDGASFDTPIVFTLVIPNEIWSDSKRYSLQWYNRTSDSWEPISTTSVADSHTLIAHITHFSIIGLFSYDIPAATPAATTPIASETPITSPPATSTPLSLCICLLAVMVVVVWWIRGRR
jgi:TolB protein